MIFRMISECKDWIRLRLEYLAALGMFLYLYVQDIVSYVQSVYFLY